MTPLLEVADLTVSFSTEDGVVRAVDGVSYSVEPGGCLGIVGESGSGKSASALAVAGLTRYSSRARVGGTVRFAGRDLLTASDEELRRLRGSEIAMIFQDPLSSLHPFYTIGVQLVEAIRVHRDMSRPRARRRAAEMLDLVGFPDAGRQLSCYPHEFSGGMRQRVMIAMALCNDPKLLIADEPTTALDVTVQAQILMLLKRLRQELGTAVVLITHDLGVVAQVTDEVVVIYAGKVVERAPTIELFDRPEHPYTWGLLRSIPHLAVSRDEQLVPISGRPPSLLHRPEGCAFHPRCPYARDEHSRTEPVLAATGGDARHQVACLLSAGERQTLWQTSAARRRAGPGPAPGGWRDDR